MSYPIPQWRVVLDGVDLTERIAPRLLDLTLTECRGGEADQLDLRIHDHDGKMALPKRGVRLAVALGWKATGLVDKGTFIVDEVEYSGAPDIITIRARSADLTANMRTRRERSWHNTTLGAVLNTLAGEHGLTPRVVEALARIKLSHLDQANESDMNLLTRLGQRFDAVATVKAGALLFTPIGAGTTVSGKPLPTVTLTRRDGDQHRYSVADRDAYSGVRAYWADKGKARRQSVLVGTDDNAKNLRESYADEATARQHAHAELERVKRGLAKFDYTLAIGRADLFPEQIVMVRGFKPEIDAQAWLTAKVTHTMDSNGFKSSTILESVLS
ncbi:phage late control protein [Xanthomonas phaseoli pv. phaseoli]|uniref:Late control gene D protein n=1 Tax=Xanthomonas campestris pv. phaseoli TaxID=317013 RepID=A0AB38DU73_XANCH|nr:MULTISPECIES: phage late control D family protein [Xanthomonas]ATS21710.1 phage late control D family protein [Xanthomonas phaseoli pv. phaseoli]ATS24517.1 phage late control D family protein [Xanthomonas phaseoli pv. phaseoli]ATS28517.1 phage late control D family protein [Xanthomonas phaseoli pv. phaseoli]ATS32834.1 phage late control D family protein [Xanthomonas phaseoli pv. phaseoli]AZU13641.1 phage late control protein [Xanthomonas phaseoli pv. phaseoli]